MSMMLLKVGLLALALAAGLFVWVVVDQAPDPYDDWDLIRAIDELDELEVRR